MKIAVVGAGVAGLGAAWSLSRIHDVVVYEREQRFGGHARTVDISRNAASVPVDMGFIVFNDRNYPDLVALFEKLGVRTQESDMSFSVSLDNGGFEYSSSYSGYIAQLPNMLNPSFARMTRDILRFNRLAPRLLERAEDLDFTIGDFIVEANLGAAFRDRYLVPMASCIWSSPLTQVLDYPAQTFTRFFANHGLLSVGAQLRWRTVSGGSRNYVQRISAPLQARSRLGLAAQAIRRDKLGVHIRDAGGQWDRFDKLILACHADQALALLTDPTPCERTVLGCFSYCSNEVWLHGDTDAMPKRRKVWSSWNYIGDSEAPASKTSVTYWMNRLQKLTGHDVFVSVNPPDAPCPDVVYDRQIFEHPMYDSAAIRAQREMPSIQGARDTYFCGSYCGYGFHEDALSAGLDIAEALGASRPWTKGRWLDRPGTVEEPRVLPIPAAARVAAEAQ